MCFPPLCEPAVRVLGCLSLRQGAMAVLMANALYGLSMVVVHALLLGEASRSSGAGEKPGGAPHRFLSAPASGGHRQGDKYAWVLQLLDLDISWGHELLGFDEVRCLVGGLLYGILALVLCLGMLQMLHMSRASLATASRCFLVFLATEVLASAILVYVKLQKMCELQQKHWPAFSMDCDALRFVYLQRAMLMLAAAALGTWVFASFSYALTFGDAAGFEKLDLAHGVELPAAPHAQSAKGLAPAAMPRTMYNARHPPPSRLSSYTGQRSLTPSVSHRSSMSQAGRYSVLPPSSHHSLGVAAPALDGSSHAWVGGA